MWIISRKYTTWHSYLLLEGRSPKVFKLLQIYSIIWIIKIKAKSNSLNFFMKIFLLCTLNSNKCRSNNHFKPKHAYYRCTQPPQKKNYSLENGFYSLVKFHSLKFTLQSYDKSASWFFLNETFNWTKILQSNTITYYTIKLGWNLIFSTKCNNLTPFFIIISAFLHTASINYINSKLIHF